jgi:hypothetical protein
MECRPGVIFARDVSKKRIMHRSCPFAIYLTTPFSNTDYRTANEGMINEYWIGKYLEGSGRGLIKVLPRHLPRRTEENDGKPQSGQPVSGMRFEPGTSRTQSRNFNHLTTTNAGLSAGPRFVSEFQLHLVSRLLCNTQILTNTRQYSYYTFRHILPAHFRQWIYVIMPFCIYEKWSHSQSLDTPKILLVQERNCILIQFFFFGGGEVLYLRIFALSGVFTPA